MFESLFGKKASLERIVKQPQLRYPFVGEALPPSWMVIDKYALNAPFAFAIIAEDPSTGVKKYFLDELPLSKIEAAIYTNLLDTLENELTVPRSEINPKTYFMEQANRIISKYKIKASQIAWPKIYYFAERDLVGFDVIDGLMRDPNIEDISADGVNRPIFVYQRKYESLETNIIMKDEERLDNLISKLAHLSGKHVSTAFPIVQGILPGRHRLAATYRREISPQGGSFTIRKFREDPLTIIDMLNLNVIDHNLASYVWLLMENNMSSLVVGSTGAGKTTLLNALLTLTRTNIKVVTIEEVQEINIPHSNWTALVSRESFGATDEHGREVSLFDLVKTAMRMRPDVLVVGEVRGEEAYVLFQAIASVTGDTPILIKEDDKVKLTSIGEFVDRFYRDGVERVPVYVSGKEVLSFTNDGSVLFRPITYLLRHKADEVYRIFYRGGEVRATASHSVFVIDEHGKIVEKQVSTLAAGEVLVSTCGSQIERNKQAIDCKEILSNLERHRSIRERLLQAFPRCGSKQTVEKESTGIEKEYRCNDFSNSFSAKTTELHTDRITTKEVSLISFAELTRIPSTIEVDRLFAKVLGVFLADGYIWQHEDSRIVFKLSKKRESLFAQDILEFFSRLGVGASIQQRETYSIYEFGNAPLANIFEYLCGKQPSDKRIPDLMWTAPTDIVDAFFEGLSNDANRALKSDYYCYTSERKELISSISWLARLAGRSSFIIERNRRYLTVYVSKIDNISRSNVIPAKLLTNLKKMLNSTAWRFIPKESAKMISKARARKAMQEIIQKKRAPLTWEASQLIDRISNFINSSLIASPILKIKREKFNGYVYDISVPGTEAFFGGESPIALHNTGHGGLGTVHADDAASAIQRLTTKPMDVPPAFIPFLDLVLTIRRVAIPLPGGGQRVVRRVLSVDEILSVGNYVKMFSWDPQTDRHIVSPLKNSVKLNRLAKDIGVTLADLADELNRRTMVLRWAQQKGIRNFRELSALFEEYRSKQKEVYERSLRELGLTKTTAEAQLEQVVEGNAEGQT